MATGVEINRSNITLPPEVSREILAKTQTDSAVMQLSRNLAIPGRGAAIQTITSDPEAAWVGETDAKPVSPAGLSTAMLQPYKLAVIVPFSNEFRRDADFLYQALVDRLPRALATKFDQTIVGSSAPGSNFTVLGGCQTAEIGTNAYAGLVGANADIAQNGGDMNGIALAPAGKAALLGAVDLSGRPIFINSAAEGAVPYVLRAPTVIGKGVADPTNDVVGIAGDWTQAIVGTVEGVKIDISDQATLVDADENVINLFQQNMMAVRAEIEVGFVADTACFNLLTATAESES